jgi:DNA repair protein SbcC/Rad50
MTILPETLTIRNFRSIRGTVSVPINAPIVLIHGANGAGKTSLLSALELAMTGDVATMRREDSDFPKYLVHEGAERAEVQLITGGGRADADALGGSIAVIDGQITGRALLDRLDAGFFAERCYLAQSVLSRLLEIYQHADPQSDSHLTHFVKDLLGLDQLDALVDGLHAAGDIRRTRGLVPEFRAAEERCRSLRSQRATAERERDLLTQAATAQRQNFLTLLSVLPSDVVGTEAPAADLTQVKNLLEREREDPALVVLAQYRRELTSIQNAWKSLPRDMPAAERSRAEQEEGAASAAAAAWRVAIGAAFEALLDHLREDFPDLPSWAQAGPQRAYDLAEARLHKELQRLNTALARDQAVGLKIQEFDEEIRRAEARIKVAEDQIGGLAKNAGELAGALAAIIPHILGQNCPVCSRDFAEVSTEPLVGHLQRTIAMLTTQAGRLSELSRASSAELTHLSALKRARETEASRQLGTDERLPHQVRAATLTRRLQVLVGLGNGVAIGTDLLRRHSNAQRSLSEARDRDRLATELRAGLETLCEKLEQPQLGDAEPLPAALDRLQQFVLVPLHRHYDSLPGVG